ncbi:MAG: PAS domain S-box protein [Chitinophagaceae bacterium]
MCVPLGIAVGAMYMFCVLLVSKSSKNFIIVFSVIICFLLAFKFFFYVNENTSWMIYVNRIASIFIILASAYFSVLFNNQMWKGHIDRESHAVKERNMNNLLENMIEGAQLIGYDWKYLYLNKALEKQAGIKRENLIGKKMSEVYPGIEKTEMFKNLEYAMINKQPIVFNNEFTFPDGKTEYFELSVQPVNEGLFLLSMIITDKVKMEKERARYTENLEQMLHITSHKIRQPVSNIIGLANQLDIKNDLSEDATKILKYMKESAVKLDVFTHELNDFIIKSYHKHDAKERKSSLN